MSLSVLTKKTYTINVTLDNENMTAEELQMAIVAMVGAAKESNISVVALSELAAAATASHYDWAMKKIKQYLKIAQIIKGSKSL